MGLKSQDEKISKIRGKFFGLKGSAGAVMDAYARWKKSSRPKLDPLKGGLEQASAGVPTPTNKPFGNGIKERKVRPKPLGLMACDGGDERNRCRETLRPTEIEGEGGHFLEAQLIG